MTKKVSIIIPLYNKEKYIEHTLKCALNQSWPNKEILIIDDGSTDKSYEIAKQYTNHEIKIYRQKHKGASAARNLGIQKSCADYVQFLDADDIIDTKKIEEQVKMLDASNQAVVSTCRWSSFKEEKSIANSTTFRDTELYSGFNPIDYIITAREKDCIMPSFAWLTPMKIIKETGGWNEQLTLNDDGEFFSRVLSKSNKVVFANNSIGYYRLPAPGHLSLSFDEESIEKWLISLKLIEHTILSMEDSERTRLVCAKQYLHFIVKTFPLYNHLTLKAKDYIEELGYVNIPNIFGSKKLKFGILIFGLDTALRLRGLKNKIFHLSI